MARMPHPLASKLNSERWQELRLRTNRELFEGAMTVFTNKFGDKAAADMLHYLITSVRAANLTERIEDLTRKTHTIDLKFDSDDEARHAMVRKLCRKMARTLLTQATLLADGRPPQAAYHNEDFFEGGSKEDLGEDFDEPMPEVPPVEVPAEETD